MKRYFIGQGTAIIAEFNTVSELNTFFNNMPDIDRHFCRLYDTQNHLTIEGWKYQYNYDWKEDKI